MSTLRRPDGTIIPPSGRTWHGRPVVTQEMLAQAVCPFTHWGARWYREIEERTGNGALLDYYSWRRARALERLARTRR